MLFVLLASCALAASPRDRVLTDSIISDALLHYFESCPRQSECVGYTVGAYKLNRMCDLFPALLNQYDRHTTVLWHRSVVEAGARQHSCGCDSLQAKLLEKGMRDTSLVVSLKAAEGYAENHCPKATDTLAALLRSSVVANRVAAVYGLEALGKSAAPALLEGLSTPNDSVLRFRDSLASWHTVDNPAPVYITGPEQSPEEVRAWVKEVEEKEATLHGIIRLALHRITGEKMSADTPELKSWIKKNLANREPDSGSANQDGKICIARLPKLNALDAYLGSKPRPHQKSVFQIVLDEHDSLNVSSDSGAGFVGLDTSIQHSIRIALDSKQRDALKFTFRAKRATSLCLFYRKAYGTWSLEPLAWHKRKCDCCR